MHVCMYIFQTSNYIITIDHHLRSEPLRDAAASAATSSKVQANFLALS